MSATESKQREREELLGLNSYSPPAKLSLDAPFSTEAEYLKFLEESRSRPDVFWKELGDALPWRTPPNHLGGPDDWYPGGTLNLAEACLAPTKDAPLHSPVLCRAGARFGETSCLSRAELIARVDALESRILAFGLAPGDRVFLALPGREMMLAAILACLRRGLTCVPQSPSYPQERLARRFQATGCQAEVLAPDVPSAVRDSEDIRRLVLEPGWEIGERANLEPVAVNSMHPAFILADSTGQLFTLPSAGFFIHALSSYRYLLDGQGAGDLLWLLNSPHHASMLSAVMAALAQGGQVGIIPDEATISVDAMLTFFKALRPRVVLANAKLLLNVIGQAVNRGQRPRGVGPSLLVVEGEMLEPRFYRALRDDIFDGDTHIVQVLSRPESGGFVAGPCPSITAVRPASVALPAPGLDLVVVNRQFEEQPRFHGGLLALRRSIPGLALELQKLDPPLLLEVKARQDDRGHFWTVGEVRVGQQRTRRVAIRELEAVLSRVKSVEQVVVIRSRDEDGKELTRAFVKPEPSAQVDTEKLRDLVSQRFSAEAMPDSFQVVRELPYSRTGKLLRSLLKRIVAGEPLLPDHVASLTDPDIVDELQQNLAETTQKSESAE